MLRPKNDAFLHLSVEVIAHLLLSNVTRFKGCYGIVFQQATE